MDIDTRIGFKNFMFVYSLEEVTNPGELMVTIPDVFIDKKSSVSESTKIAKGNMNLLRNTNLPAFSKYYISKNYVYLPVIKNFGGVSNIVGPSIMANGNCLEISSSQETNFPMSVGIGNVKVGDRLLAVFINNNPSMGMIIARC